MRCTSADIACNFSSLKRSAGTSIVISTNCRGATSPFTTRTTNLFASRIRSGFGEVSMAIALRIWKQHAREFLGLRRYLKQRRVLINYNRWVAERCYRREIATDLAIEFSDASIGQVPAAGNGRSFDGRRHDGNAHRMSTMERWKHFAGDATFTKLFDDEVHALSRRIFGDIGYAPSRRSRSTGVASRKVAATCTAGT